MIHIGSRLRISSYSHSVRSRDHIHIVIRPSTVFGDGSHATTHMCLELLECEINAGDTVLDVGTGTGILAIAAAKLGARRVIAADIDWDSCQAASENIALNRVEHTVRVFQGSVEALHPDTSFNVAVTNLYNADQVKAVLPGLARRVALHGKIICTGIWRGREEEMIHLLREEDLALRNQKTLDAFIAIAAMKVK